jgi:hypothetical protein
MYSAAVLIAAGSAAIPALAHAEETAALRLLRRIQAVQAEHSHMAAELLPPLIELGELWANGQCDRAIDMLDLALDVSRSNFGLFNKGQLGIYEPLLKCYYTLDRPADLRRAQHYVLLIHETAVGRNDPRLLPALDEAAHRYENIGLYLSARRLHRRAIDILRGAAGARGRRLPHDLRLLAPLRGMARAFRLEYTFGLAPPDLAELPTEFSDLRSRANFRADWGVWLDPLGQRSLEQAVNILRSHPDADRNERLDTLLELADWYQLADKGRDALRAYRDYWNEYAAAATAATTAVDNEPITSGNVKANDTQDAGNVSAATATAIDAAPDADLLSEPVPLMARPETGRNLRRAPVDPDQFTKYTVELAFTVTRAGQVTDIKVVESNAPKHIEAEAAQDLQSTRYRPRFVNGEPVDTPGVHHRQNVFVRTSAPDIQAAY